MSPFLARNEFFNDGPLCLVLGTSSFPDLKNTSSVFATGVITFLNTFRLVIVKF
jgi:hypothetical protein